MKTQHLDVLIVDDSKDAADLMAALMTLLGHSAKAAYSGREAIDVVDEMPPLCVMLDVHMPDMNGLELAQTLRKKCGQSMVLIAVTGAEDKLATDVFDLVDCHFFKPVSAEALAKVLGSQPVTVARDDHPGQQRDRIAGGRELPDTRFCQDQKHSLASPKRKEFFELIGATNIRTFINPTEPTSVALMMDVPDMEKFGAAMQSKDAADAMAHDGVLPETAVVCIEA